MTAENRASYRKIRRVVRLLSGHIKKYKTGYFIYSSYEISFISTPVRNMLEDN